MKQLPLTVLFFLLVSIHSTYCQTELKGKTIDNENDIPLLMVSSIYQDSKGFMWFGSYNGLYRYDGYELFAYKFDHSDSTTIGDNKISQIIEDRDNNLWIGTQNGLNYLDTKHQSFKRYNEQNSKLPRSYITSLLIDQDHMLWISDHKGIYNYDYNTYQFKLFTDNIEFKSAANEYFLMSQDHEGNLLFNNLNELKLYNKENETINTITVFENKKIGNDSEYLKSFTSQDGVIWLGGHDGLKKIRINEEGEYSNFKIEVIKESKPEIIFDIYQFNPNKLLLVSKNGVSKFSTKDDIYESMKINVEGKYLTDIMSSYYSSEDQILWLGSSSVGVIKVDLKKSNFQTISFDLFDPVTGPSTFFNLEEVRPNTIVIPSKSGLKYLDVIKESINSVKLNAGNPFISNQVTSVYKSNRKSMFIGTINDLYHYDIITQQFTSLSSPIDNFNLQDSYTRDLLEDSKNNLWVSTWNQGIFRFSENREIVTRYLNDKKSDTEYYNATRTIFEDSKGFVWIGSRGGLHRYDYNTDSIRTFESDPLDSTSISVNTAFDIYEDSRGFIWLGTYGGGLNKYNPDDHTFQSFTTKDGLIGNTVFCVLPDSKENLWLLSYEGLTKFNPFTYEAEIFNQSSGLGSDEYDAFFYGQSEYTGKIFIGGRHGIDVFHPDSIRKCQFKPNIIFTDLEVFNQSVKICGNNTNPVEFCIPQEMSVSNRIEFNHDHKVFSVKYAALDYNAPENIEYAYKLEGFIEDWQYVKDQRTVTFTNLDPGEYTLVVKATNADKVWNEKPAKLKLTIAPPWWQTKVAYLGYMFILGFIAIATYRFQKRRLQLNAQLEFEKNEAIRLKELDKLKTNLYSNITHEFRTPLTVILGQSNAIKDEISYAKKSMIISKVNTIERNGDQLLSLVNQLLDLSKIEAGHLTLHYIQDDIVVFIKYLLESFTSFAKQQHIELQSQFDVDQLKMDFDPKRIKDLVSNLLTNAIKFTEENGIVKLRISKDTNHKMDTTSLKLEIIDNGIGIAENQLQYIFDRFYQVDDETNRFGEGTGIGLAFVKELVKLMDGEIAVQSKFGEGTTFEVMLPITNMAERKRTKQKSNSKVLFNLNESQRSNVEEQPILLIVEDNADVREYIASCVAVTYHIIEAENGQIGFEKALHFVPDIIISDVMMPKVDGFEFCHRMKSHVLTSHIPIILLTARATDESKLQGLEHGADAYLTKPFLKEELMLRLSNLITLKENIKIKYLNGKKASQTDMDFPFDTFVSSVKEKITEHMDDANLNPTMLAGLLFISVSQLHRKLKAVTGKSTGQFIHSIKLERGRELLKSTEMSIAQIAFEVGYKEHTTFSTHFKREFGQTPSSVR